MDLDQAIAEVQSPEAKAFLDTIAGPESKGRYNIRFDGGSGATFDDYSQHPQVRERIPDTWPQVDVRGKSSDAAGRYQFLSSTWNDAAQRLGLPGAETGNASFDPYFQDLGAWDLATETYHQHHPTRNLLEDLRAGNVGQVMGTMRTSRQWDTADPRAYAGNLARVSQVAQAGVPDAASSGVERMGSSPNDWTSAFVNGTLPGMQPREVVQPETPLGRAIGAAPAVGSPIPLDAPLSGIDALAAAGKSPSSPVTGSGAQPPTPQAAAPSSESAPAIDVNGLISAYNQYRSFPAGVPLAQAALGALEKLIPAGGYELQTDGSIKLRAGYAPATQELKTSEALGTNLQTRGPAGEVMNLSGVVDAAAQRKTAEQLASELKTMGPNGVVSLPGADTAAAQRSMSTAAGTAAGQAPFEIIKGVTLRLPGGEKVTMDIPRPQYEAMLAPLLRQQQTGAPSGVGSMPTPAGPDGPSQAGTPQPQPQMSLSGAPVLSPEQTEISKTLGEQYKAISQAALKSPEVLGRVGVLEAAADNFPVGATAEARLASGRFVTDIFGRLGIPLTKEFQNMVASGEAINKEGGQLVADLVRSMGSREAFAVWQQVKGFMPAISMSDGGYKIIVNSIKQGALRDAQLGSFQEQWLADPSHHNSTSGMSAAFNKAHPIETYSSKVMPIPTEKAGGEFVPGAIYKSPNGQTALRTPDGKWQVLQ